MIGRVSYSFAQVWELWETVFWETYTGEFLRTFMGHQTSTDPARPTRNVSSPWKPSMIRPPFHCHNCNDSVSYVYTLLMVILSYRGYFTQLTPDPLLEGRVVSYALYILNLADCLTLSRCSISPVESMGDSPASFSKCLSRTASWGGPRG